MSSAKSVAKELVHLSLSGPVLEPLTYFRLQSLLYYAQAWSLVLRGSELFPDEIVWQVDGPVVRDLFDARDADQALQVVRPEFFNQEPNLDAEDEAVFLRHLWATYGFLSSSWLFAAIQGSAPFLMAKKELEWGEKGLVLMNDLDKVFHHPIFAPLAAYYHLRKESEKKAELAILSSPPLDREAIWKGCRSSTPSASKP